MATRDVEVTLKVLGDRDVGLAVADDDTARLTLGDTYIGGGGTKDYERLVNKPQIEEVELVGNKDIEDFGVNLASDYDIAMLFK